MDGRRRVARDLARGRRGFVHEFVGRA
jgi:hypothetical protein